MEVKNNNSRTRIYVKFLLLNFHSMFKTNTQTFCRHRRNSVNRECNSFHFSKTIFAWIAAPIMWRINLCRINSLCWFIFFFCASTDKISAVLRWPILRTKMIDKFVWKTWSLYIFTKLSWCVMRLRIMILNIYRKWAIKAVCRRLLSNCFPLNV